MFRHPVIWPGRELEVTDLAFLIGAALNKQTDKSVKCKCGGNVLKCVCINVCMETAESAVG